MTPGEAARSAMYDAQMNAVIEDYWRDSTAPKPVVSSGMRCFALNAYRYLRCGFHLHLWNKWESCGEIYEGPEERPTVMWMIQQRDCWHCGIVKYRREKI